MEEKEPQQGMRLNKYIAHCGICNRREANAVVKGGLVKINDEVIKNPATKVQEGDVVKYRNHVVAPREPMVYVLMNKPKKVSLQDEDNVRKSVLDIVQPKYEQSLIPIGHLGTMDVGLVLLTNDETLIEKLQDPNLEYTSIYHLVLDKEFSVEDIIRIQERDRVGASPLGIEAIDFLKPEEDRTEIGIELSKGSSQILHTLFQEMGYIIEKLDCMNFANLTKKDLPRGWFRNLVHKEIVLISHFSK